MAQFSFESYETLKKKLISFLSPLFRNNFLEKHSNKNLTQEPKALSRALSKLEKSQANQNSIYKFEGQQEGWICLSSSNTDITSQSRLLDPSFVPRFESKK